MELRVLRYFLAVAREESITGAAAALHLTQPTLSKQLKDLEHELGATLLSRGSRRTTLTKEGLLLRERAQEIVDLADKTALDITGASEGVRGDICIGGGESEAMRLVARTARELHRDYPTIRYHLFSGNVDDVSERLDRGLLDFGILIEPTDVTKYEHLRLPATGVWGLLMRRDNPLSAYASVRPEHLRALPIVCSERSLAGSEISGWFGPGLERLNVVATYNLIYNAFLMVEEGVGCAFCLDILVSKPAEDLCFRPLSPALTSNLGLAWPKHRPLSRAKELFLERLQNELT